MLGEGNLWVGTGEKSKISIGTPFCSRSGGTTNKAPAIFSLYFFDQATTAMLPRLCATKIGGFFCYFIVC
jgi:hypothetical protein